MLAHHHGLLKQRVGAQCLLDVTGRQLLAGGGHDDFLDAADDAHLSIDDLGLVAGFQPAVVGECLLRVFGSVPVAHHHIGAARLQLLVLADAHFHARQRLAHGGRVVVLQRVGGQHRRGLGHPEALHQLQPQA
ncbi:hypothetical protein D3C72_1959490 [compost metagenome]